jgi:cytoskeletal protein RodZ
MKTNNKKFTHVIRSFEDAVGFDEEADIERYEKFANAKKQKKVEMEEQTLAKKPSKLRDNKKFEEDLDW